MVCRVKDIDDLMVLVNIFPLKAGIFV